MANEFVHPLTPMFHAIGSLLAMAWGKDAVTYTQGYPPKSDPEVVKAPIITYRVVRKKPFASEIKPRPRPFLYCLDNTQEAVEVYGMRRDCLVRFAVWERSVLHAYELAERFEEFMLLVCGELKKRLPRIDNIVLEEMQTNSPETNLWRVDLFSAHLDFRVVVDQIIPVRHPVLERLDVVVRSVLSAYGEEPYHEDDDE